VKNFIFATGFTAASVTDGEYTMARLIRILQNACGVQRTGESLITEKAKVYLGTSDHCPQTRVEEIVVSMLSTKQQIPLSELAEQLAEALYRDELRNGGWVADLGLLGSGAFVADALHEINTGDGRLWNVVGSDGSQ
jgi:hypothetical protein